MNKSMLVAQAPKNSAFQKKTPGAVLMTASTLSLKLSKTATE